MFSVELGGLLWVSMFSKDRNMIARITVGYVLMPRLPSLPYQSPSMVSIPPPTILHTYRHTHTAPESPGMFATHVQHHNFAMPLSRKGPAHFVHLFASTSSELIIKIG